MSERLRPSCLKLEQAQLNPSNQYVAMITGEISGETQLAVRFRSYGLEIRGGARIFGD
jgi:hypothetical protein